MELVIDFAGEIHRLTPAETLTFGREADLTIDTNPYMHRTLGQFRWSDTSWWVQNLGTSIMLDIVDHHSTSQMSVAPGASVPLAFVKSVMRFQAGSARYELGLAVDGRFPIAVIEEAPGPLSRSSVDTVNAAMVKLNREQFRLLLALAEPQLVDRLAGQVLPTNREAADRLGWSISKFNRKLDNLCVKFSRLGVAGLKGDVTGLATSRRELLVRHVIRVGIVAPQDLTLLDQA